MLMKRAVRAFLPIRLYFTVCAIGFLTLAQLCVAVPRVDAQTARRLPTPRPTPLKVQGNRSAFAPAGPIGPAVEGISLALEPQLKPYRIGNPIYLMLYTVNTTRKQAAFRSRSEVRFEVVGAHSEKVRHQEYDARVLARAGVYDREVGIPTGRMSAWAADLSETYEITEPGTYQVRATITLRGSHAMITSPWVTITVAPKTR